MTAPNWGYVRAAQDIVTRLIGEEAGSANVERTVDLEVVDELLQKALEESS